MCGAPAAVPGALHTVFSRGFFVVKYKIRLFEVIPQSLLVTTIWVEKKMRDTIKKWHVYVDTALAYISAVLVMFMMVLSSTDILLRYLFNRPIAGAYELMQFVMGGVAFLAFSYVQLKRANITVDVVSEKFTGRTEVAVDILSLLLMFFISAIMAWQGGANALDAWREGDVTIGLVELPVGPAKMVVPVGCGILCLRLISQLVERIAKLIRGSTN